MPNTTAVNGSGISTSASDRVNSNKEEGTKISGQTGTVLRSSETTAAADTISHDQRAELNRAARSEERSKDFGGERFRTQKDRTVQTRNVQDFLERLPEIQRQLLEAETAPNRAFAEFMARVMPTEMQLRAPLRALQDDYKTMDEMGVHRASQRPDGDGSLR